LNPALLLRKCKVCGKEFKIRPIEFLSGKIRKHCSVECRKRRNVMACKACGKEFEYPRGQSKHRKYCSVACYQRSTWASGIELLVEEILKEYGIEYKAEVALGNYSIDFVLPRLNIALEVDGSYWHGTSGKLKSRVKTREKKDRLITEAGYRSVKVSEEELKEEPERKVLKNILASLQV
jgi:very-short-patch-repair endonuclease